MLRKMSYRQKNKLLFPVAGAGILLCWIFAFSRTVEAVQLNRELNGQVVQNEDLSFNPVHAQRKLDALQSIVKSYQINETTWSNELWLKASAMAMKRHVGIDYTLTRPSAEKDTTQLGKTEMLYCYGNYSQLVGLIDTLERAPAIGKISALQIKSPKPDVIGERAHQCILKIEFRGMPHERE
ncbi:hypothetical protein [Pedobacter sp. L105]|uniref:hypothetical protein n=1 Tax=Pedobacter sp. L105 TaxID=1641871 RepID=UPI001C202D80|nr:hypothetical protein [Pedobacter sp. L105]